MTGEKTMKKNVPVVTRTQMIEVDRRMIEEYGISLLQMMENAGRNLAELSRRRFGGPVNGRRILVICGGGNNGGGGMAAARHLANRGAVVTVALAVGANTLKGAPLHQLQTLRKMKVTLIDSLPEQRFDLLLDALIGYGLKGAPRDQYANWINWINSQDALKISLDIPSGLDADTGVAPGACVQADATLTLALPKAGMMAKETQKYIGDLYLGDISVPPRLLEEMGISSGQIFGEDSIVLLNG